MSHNGTLPVVADWYLNQAITYGWIPVLAVTAIACTAAWCGLGVLLNGGAVMTVDLYAAWLTAGNNLQPVGAWLGARWIGLTVAVVAAGVAWWALRRASRQVDQILHDEPAEPDTEWGVRDELLLDAHLAQYGPAGLQRLRDAIEQARKEKP